MKPLKTIALLVFIAFLAAGCTKSTPTVNPTQPPVQNTAEPSPTEPPMALKVNGEGILLADYEADITRLQMALTETGEEMTPEQQKERVTSNLIDELLLSQAAVQAGQNISDEKLQQRIDTLVNDVGGQEKFNAWLTQYGFTDASFRAALRRSILAAWQRDQIINSVPTTADQVHAAQLLYQDKNNAEQALSKIKSGVDFETLAREQDPTLAGDLGWFPQGTLTQPQVEQAVFALQPGETSEVIESSIGFHIIHLIDRDAQHPLSIEARRKLQELKLDEWLKASRDVSTIEILIP